jgi:hypothetical protein
LAGNDASAARDLQASSLVLAVAACFLAVVWLIAIAGDPSDGLAFYMAAYGGALLLGIGLVIAASRRRDIFGNLGLAGAVVILVASLTIDALTFAAAVFGVILMGAAVAQTERRLLPGLVILGIGLVGFAVRMEASSDAYLIFVPVVAAASAILSATFRQI